jgi:threonine dehydratase
MWSHIRGLLDGAFSVSLDDTAAAVRLLAGRARVVAEGAGALALAAALPHGWDENVVCVVSGGNIDSSKLSEILAGRTP